MSSDAFEAYRNAIDTGLSDRCDYGQIIKLYGRLRGPRRLLPASKNQGTIKAAISGNPSNDRVCTSHIERKNGSLRQWCKRFTRLTYSFSKKWAKLDAALALHFCFYNFCRVHGTLKVTPAIEAGVADHVWNLDELLMEAVGQALRNRVLRNPPNDIEAKGGKAMIYTRARCKSCGEWSAVNRVDTFAAGNWVLDPNPPERTS